MKVAMLPGAGMMDQKCPDLSIFGPKYRKITWELTYLFEAVSAAAEFMISALSISNRFTLALWWDRYCSRAPISMTGSKSKFYNT